MRRLIFAAAVSALVVMIAASARPQAQASGPYKILKTQKVGGNGGFDYVNADPDGRRLYVARRADAATNQPARISVFDLDTLAPVGELTNVNAHGVAIDPKSGHGFASSKPVTMFDTKTLKVIKTIDVDAASSPDGLLYDPFNQRIHVLSHPAPNDTVIDAADGSIVGTITIPGNVEQAQSDGKGLIYVDLENNNAIAVVDAKTLKVTGTYDVASKCEGPGGLGLDAKNHILFATCGGGSVVVVSATDGKMLTSFTIGAGTDGGGFNPATMEAFSSNGSGSLSIIKEQNPTTFVLAQELATVAGGNFKTMTIDSKTNHVLLIGAEYQAAPAPTTPPPAGGRAGGARRTMVPDSFTILVVGR